MRDIVARIVPFMRRVEQQTGLTMARRGKKVEAGEFQLEEFLPYLLNQAAEATSRSFQEVYRTTYGMTRTQWRVLANLGRFGAMTASDICRISHIEKTKVSRAIAALEREDLVNRRESDTDKRSEILTLTPRGEKRFAELGRQAIEHDRQVRAQLGTEVAEQFTTVLRTLIAIGEGRGEAEVAQD